MLNICKVLSISRIICNSKISSLTGRRIHILCRKGTIFTNNILILPQKPLDYYIIRVIPCLSAKYSTNTQKDGKKPTFIQKAVEKVIPAKKDGLQSRLHFSRERNFLTTIRAMNEFLLNTSDLEDLQGIKRRSAFDDSPPMTVYWRKDVENKAVEVWGSLEALDKEKKKRKTSHEVLQKRLTYSYRNVNQNGKWFSNALYRRKNKSDSASYVVWAAVIVNSTNLLMKSAAWLYTGSHSLFAEVLHSFADVTNQLILAYGIYKSKQVADVQHPYGFTSMRYVSSLISGAMIFCIGSGLSLHHGISGLLTVQEPMPMHLGLLTLCGSFITEGITLVMAVNATRRGARSRNMSFKNYVMRGNDPTVNVILLEDFAAVLSILTAISCMSATSIYGSHIPDAVGSCIIGGILACVSGFIIHTNSNALVGRSIPEENLNVINNELEEDVMIRAIHDVKGIDIGSGLVRYKAEIDFDGRELTKAYLRKKDIHLIFKDVNHLKTPEEVEKFLLIHGENIVDSLGGEVDRIEKNLKKKHPEVRHCDLEVL